MNLESFSLRLDCWSDDDLGVGGILFVGEVVVEICVAQWNFSGCMVKGSEVGVIL